MIISEAWYTFKTIAESQLCHNSVTVATKVFKFVPSVDSRPMKVPRNQVLTLQSPGQHSYDLIPFLCNHDMNTKHAPESIILHTITNF